MNESDKSRSRSSILPKELEDLDSGWGEEEAEQPVFRSSLPPKKITPTKVDRSSHITQVPQIPADDFAKRLMQNAEQLGQGTLSPSSGTPQPSKEEPSSASPPRRPAKRQLTTRNDIPRQAPQQETSEAPPPPATSEDSPNELLELSPSALPTQPPPSWFRHEKDGTVPNRDRLASFAATEAPPPPIIDEEEFIPGDRFELTSQARSPSHVPTPVANSLTSEGLLQGANLAGQGSDENQPAQLDLVGSLDEENANDEMNHRFAMGDFSGALSLAQEVLKKDPEHAEAKELATRCEDVSHDMYLSRLGSLSLVPRVVMTPDQIRWLSLDHRAGFLLSLIDGFSSVEEVLDVCGMSQTEALKIFCQLLEDSVIATE
ncbi:MAG: hypothetical protein MK135_16355 [Polyangiaceae bacterium]|nr:hypothetical protein [Polyangiaceae bacterium]